MVLIRQRLHGLLALWAALVIHRSQSSRVHPHRNCGTITPDADKLAEDFETISTFRSRPQRKSVGGELCIGCVTVNTYFHRIKNVTGAGSSITNDLMKDQMKVLNERFATTPFQFKLKGKTTTVNNIWFSNITATSASLTNEIGAALRVGNYATLNVYFIGDGEASFASFPAAQKEGDTSFISDGIFMRPGSVPGIIIVHEVGHWLGLLHTFQGESCDPNNPNDFVDDTPQQANYTESCPSDATNTCPGLPGNDPIHNYMDYSSEDCRSEFTPGQIERMYALFLLYRQAHESCSTGQMQFELKVKFDQSVLDQQFQLATASGDIIFNTLTHDAFRYDNATTVHVDLCIPNGKYIFTAYDGAGNGILPPGYYKVFVDGVLVKENSGGNPFFNESTTILPDNINPTTSDSFKPVCTVTSVKQHTWTGQATENKPTRDIDRDGVIDGDTGIKSVVLKPGSVNVRLNVPSFVQGDRSIKFTAHRLDTRLTKGNGIVLVTDGSGNTCALEVQFSSATGTSDLQSNHGNTLFRKGHKRGKRGNKRSKKGKSKRKRGHKQSKGGSAHGFIHSNRKGKRKRNGTLRNIFE